jgi:hypothetical protein
MKIVWNIDRGSDAHAIIMSLSVLRRQPPERAIEFAISVK